MDDLDNKYGENIELKEEIDIGYIDAIRDEKKRRASNREKLESEIPQEVKRRIRELRCLLDEVEPNSKEDIAYQKELQALKSKYYR